MHSPLYKYIYIYKDICIYIYIYKYEVLRRAGLVRRRDQSRRAFPNMRPKMSFCLPDSGPDQLLIIGREARSGG